MEIYLLPWILLPLPGWMIICQDYMRVYQKLQIKVNFLELPHWVSLHRFRWKSIFNLESSYCFQAGSLFVKFTRGSVRNCKQRQTFWSTNVASKKQRLLHRWDSLHCIACNTDSPIHIHKFIPPEVWKAFNVGINAWSNAPTPVRRHHQIAASGRDP